MQQKTVDLYMKGERKPSVEFIKNICTAFGVSADWLLGLPERVGSATATIGPGAATPSRAAASMPPSPPPPPDCSRCQLMAAHIREITGRK